MPGESRLACARCSRTLGLVGISEEELAGVLADVVMRRGEDESGRFAALLGRCRQELAAP